MISYGKQSIDQSDIEAVVKVLKGDWLTQGPAVDAFENDLKHYFGANHACAVANGTAALHLIGLALGWQSEDVVITTPITFLATANCIVYAGATPDFVDIDPATYTIDPNQVEEKVKAYQLMGNKVKAVIGVDYAGHPCDWKSLREIANKYDFQLVNDNCHALGASYYGEKQYAVKYADVVTQSYHPVKHITTGEGGAVLTNDPSIDEKIRRLRTHGMTKDPGQMESSDGPWYYEMHEVGYNYRITDIQCALGISQLKKLDKFVKQRQKIAQWYDEVFCLDDKFIIPVASEDSEHSYHLYPLQIKFKDLAKNRKELFYYMEEKSIRLQVHYLPLHLQPYYKKYYGFNLGDLPNAEEYYCREVTLPIYYELNYLDVDRINNELKIILGAN